MCGIVGVFPVSTNNQKLSPNLRKALALWFHNEVLYHTVKRGKDATGLVATFGNHYDTEKETAPYFWACIKQPVDTEDFFNNDGTDKRYAGQKKNANITYMMDRFAAAKRPLMHIIGHARAKTKGSETNPNNNHPILVNNIIGVHNGGVTNYEKIYEKHGIKPIGDVDSEAIMQLFAEIAPDRALTIEDIAYVTERIEGPRAVMAFNNQFPDKIALFRDKERPVEISILEELGLMIIHSERDFLKQALNTYTRLRMVYAKSMPGEEQLPAIREVQGHLMPDEGAIIDLDKPFKTGTVREWLGFTKLPDTLAEYKKYASSTTSSNGTIYSSHNHANHNVAKPKPAPAVTEADVEDLSGYVDLEDDVDVNSSQESITVDSKAIMDDAGSDDTLGPTSDSMELAAMAEIVHEEGTSEDDGGTTENESEAVFSFEELRKMAEGSYLDPEYKDDPRSAANRLKGKFAKMMCVNGMSEEDAEEAAMMLYPEFFSDGYTVGYPAGMEFMEEAQHQQMEEMSQQCEALSAENNRLKAELEIERAASLKAAKHMANLKGFIMASLMAKDLISVDKTGEIEFDEDIEDLLDMDRMFRGVNVSNVRKLFGAKEKKMISSGLAAELRKTLARKTVS